MATIPQFTARAPRRGSLEVSTDTGAVQALAGIAQASSALTNRIGRMADQAAAREGTEAGSAGGLAVSMPGTEFVYDGSTAPAMRGDISKIVSEAAMRHGQDPQALMRIVQIESGGNPAAKNPNSSAGGLLQFIDSTAAQYGLQNRFDPVQAADAGARLMRDNRAHLKRVLGREPNAGELYLAHQQGAAGAAKLLSNPNTPAADIVGADAVRLNAGQAGMTAGQFANLWIHKAGGAPSVVGAAPSAGVDPGGVRVMLTGSAGPLPQQRADTIRGEAFNRAATDVYTNRLNTAMRAQMDAVALEHQGDPAGLAQALEALRAGYVSDLPPQAAAVIDQSFSAQKFGLERQAVTAFNNQLENANIAAFEENISARQANAYRIAAAGGLDASADEALTAELSAMDAQIDASPLTPLQKSMKKTEARGDIMAARVLGGFDAQQDPSARAAYVQAFQEQWKSGEGMAGTLDLNTYDKINAKLIARSQADAAAAEKQRAALDGSIKGQIGFLKKGFPVSEANRRFLQTEIARTNDPALAERFNFLDGLANWQQAHIAARPELIDAQIAALRTKMHQEGTNEAALTTIGVMEGLRDEMRKGLSEDPLTWAGRAGVASVSPLNFSDSATLATSLADRVADATAVAAHYGVDPKYFTPAEADGLKKMLKSSPLAMPSIVSSLSAGLGEATLQALGEISKDAPLLAHVAGMVHATGRQGAAVEIAEALAIRAEPTYKSALPSAAKLQGALAEQLGSALAVLPGTIAGARETAAALFEARAIARGISMDDFDQAGSPSRELYAEALDEVLGASTRDGVKYGGLTSVNGFQTIAPPDIAADRLDDMISNISADDLLFQMQIGSANGMPIRLDELRRGRLVMTAQGRYRVALGDVQGGDPRYVPDLDGGYWELDVGMLSRSQVETDFMRRRRTLFGVNQYQASSRYK